MNDHEIGQMAVAEIKHKKREIITRFAGEEFPKLQSPVSIFMAGSPGAGKTEFSKRFLEAFENGTIGPAFLDNPKITFTKTVRIDPDEIRDLISAYNGTNAYLFQGAVSKGVAVLVDYCNHYGKSYILDGTLSKFDIAMSNIERSVNRKRPVILCYVYQDPLKAWEFTQARERLEGRRIEKVIFVEEFLSARDSVVKLKKIFGNQIQVWVIIRDHSSNTYEITVNVDNVDKVVKSSYSKEELLKIL